MSRCDLPRTRWPRLDLSRSNLSRSDLPRADLPGSHLARLDLPGPSASGSSRANAIGSGLTAAHASGARATARPDLSRCASPSVETPGSGSADRSGARPEITGGDGVRLGLLVLGLLRQVAALGEGS